ncbi:hypothetical protein PsorP6_011376 [Peronosclerospora sorghi]|uniref:Uncharacterized protein n=1 Tax=Peronosclerospora sorghi TaxID=230839 RepID=A0ACC0WJR5_9STRA|nr:hypothetical protein PsorP6_011376 [Peronosclerospora sorghi]
MNVSALEKMLLHISFITKVDACQVELATEDHGITRIRSKRSKDAAVKEADKRPKSFAKVQRIDD